MSKYLFIRLGAAGDDGQAEASWLAPGGQVPEVVQNGSLAQAAAQAAGRRVVVIVPGTDVLVTRAALHARQRQRLLKAVPYAVEDQLADDVEDMHFAVGEPDESGAVAVAAVARGRIDQWLSQLRQAGLEPQTLIPDFLALPVAPDGWSLRQEGDAVLVRSGPYTGFALEVDNLEHVLPSILDDAPDSRPPQLHAVTAQQPGGWPVLADLCSAQGIELSVLPPEQGLLQSLSGSFGESPVLNLLQGEYSSTEKMGRLWRPWRVAAALLGLWAVLHTGVLVADYVRLSQRSRAVDQNITKLFQQTFPDARKVVNPRLQMEQRMAELRRGAGFQGEAFFSLLARFGAGVDPRDRLQVQRMEYRDGKLDVDFRIVDLQALDHLKQRLVTKEKLEVEILSASAQGNLVEARLQLREHQK